MGFLNKDNQTEGSETNTEVKDAVAEAVAKERERASSVMGLDSYKGREALAAKLLATDMDVKAIDETLQAAPAAVQEVKTETPSGEGTETKVETKPANSNASDKSASHFEEHMNSKPSPEVGGDETETGSEQTQADINREFLTDAADCGVLTGFNDRGEPVALQRDEKGAPILDRSLIGANHTGSPNGKLETARAA